MSHDDFQPPEFDAPDMDDDDRMYGALTDLASIDTHDTNLRDHPKAHEVLDRLMTHAYGDGRKDERQEWLPVLGALRIHHEWSIRNMPGYSEWGDERVAYRATAAAIAIATGEQQ